MANPATRQELADYGKRQLGAPVLEVNVADEQVEDLLDDAISEQTHGWCRVDVSKTSCD